MENSYTKWKEMQEDKVTYKRVQDSICIQYQAYKNDCHFATIVVWSHKVNKSCFVLWFGEPKITRLFGSEDEAREFVES